MPVLTVNFCRPDLAERIFGMKFALKLIRILLIVAVLAGILGIAWWLFSARITAWYYDTAAQSAVSSGNLARAADMYADLLEKTPRDEQLRLDTAELYRQAGNYTRAEFLVQKGLVDVGPSVGLICALSKLYVEQDKLYDAVALLDGATAPSVINEVNSMRPSPPVFSHKSGQYSEIITVSVSQEDGCVSYVSWEDEIPSVSRDAYDGPVTLAPGLTSARAVAVNGEGLVSSWQGVSYKLEDIVLPLEFEDAEIERLIRLVLERPEGILLTSDLWDIDMIWSDEPAKYTTLADLQKCTSLKTVHLVGDRTPSDISALSSLQSVTELYLVEFGIDSFDLEHIGKMTWLETLDLSDNSIASIAELGDLGKLRYLNLSLNSVQDIAALGHLTALEKLNLSQNTVQDIRPLGALSRLDTLLLPGNNLSLLNGAESLGSLRVLDVSGNRILCELEPLKTLTKLEEVYAGHCALEKLPDMSVMSALRVLDVSYNGISTDDEVRGLEGLAGVKSLTSINISNNTITNITPLGFCLALTTVEASHNGITSVAPLKDLPNLNLVRIEHNKLTSLAPLRTCPVLKEVYAFGNSLTDALDLFAGTGITVYRN